MFDGTTTGAAYDGFRDRVLGVTFYPGIPVNRMPLLMIQNSS